MSQDLDLATIIEQQVQKAISDVVPVVIKKVVYDMGFRPAEKEELQWLRVDEYMRKHNCGRTSIYKGYRAGKVEKRKVGKAVFYRPKIQVYA